MMKYAKFILSCLMFVLIVGTHKSSGFLSQEQRTSIDDFILPLLECRNVPGLTLGVIFGDGQKSEDVYSRGFGSRDILSNLTVESSTGFAIGGITASFTTTLIAKLLHTNTDRYPKGWDTPVMDILGKDFRLWDNLRSEFTTLRDLAAHKAGYPQFNSMVAGLDPKIRRSEFCRRYFLLKPKYEFRKEYHYSREMFTLLGCVAEVMGNGASWEELIQTFFLKPLGMTSTNFVTAHNKEIANSYMFNTKTFQSLDPLLLSTLYPCDVSDGLISTSEDMIQWLNYHLVNLANTSRIQEGLLLEETYLPQIQYKLGRMNDYMPHSSVHQAVFAHNLGWESGIYRGFRFIQSEGQVTGYTSKVTVFRDYKLGIFLSMNIGDSETDKLTADIISMHIVDLLLQVGRPTFLTHMLACYHEYPFAHEGIFKSRYPDVPSKQNGDLPLKKNSFSNEKWQSPYVGRYGHQMFGNVTVTFNSSENQLMYKTGLLGEGRLVKSANGEDFLLRFNGPLAYLQDSPSQQAMAVAFVDLKAGKYSQLQVLADDISYTRNASWEIDVARESIPQSSGNRRTHNIFVVLAILMFHRILIRNGPILVIF